MTQYNRCVLNELNTGDLFVLHEKHFDIHQPSIFMFLSANITEGSKAKIWEIDRNIIAKLSQHTYVFKIIFEE